MSATELKDKIKDLRQQAGLTMRQLADAVNVSEATISRWESGNISNMRRDKIYDLAKALNTTPAYLMGWEECSEEDTQTHKQQSKTSSEKRMVLVARHLDKVPEDQREKILKNIEETVENYLDILGIDKED